MLKFLLKESNQARQKLSMMFTGQDRNVTRICTICGCYGMENTCTSTLFSFCVFFFFSHVTHTCITKHGCHTHRLCPPIYCSSQTVLFDHRMLSLLTQFKVHDIGHWESDPQFIDHAQSTVDIASIRQAKQKILYI